MGNTPCIVSHEAADGGNNMKLQRRGFDEYDFDDAVLAIIPLGLDAINP